MIEERMAIWTGTECSVVRIGNEYRDQLKETGHYDRISDLDLLSETGIKTLRYPVLMEHVRQDHFKKPDWSIPDKFLGRLQELGIEPIVGLVHHGGGPSYTNLLDPLFPLYVSTHAQEVAKRYPWIKKWTPINEPLTTARFSGLYATWYPHKSDDNSFLKILYHECKAVVYSMMRIKDFVPDAELVQTEDMGKTFATPEMQWLADHYNERRWLSFDLLTGKVTEDHPFFQAFIDAGIHHNNLELFQYKDVVGKFLIGINHYITSDRWLDHRPELFQQLDRWTDCHHADVEAVRVRDCPAALGFRHRLEEVHERYPDHPIAVTECHLGHDQEDQLRWLLQTWEHCLQLRERGVPIKALTVWAVFGSLDWDSLLTQKQGHYESGVFHLKDGKLERTLLTDVVKKLAEHGDYYDGRIEYPGWWERDERFFPHPGRD
jgi:dTDP-4-dehydrorhamnose reductase